MRQTEIMKSSHKDLLTGSWSVGRAGHKHQSLPTEDVAIDVLLVHHFDGQSQRDSVLQNNKKISDETY